MGVRVFKLAKELDMSSKDLIAYLQTQGLKVTSHMSAVDENVAQILKDRLPKKVQGRFTKKAAAEKKKKKKVKADKADKITSGNGGATAVKPPLEKSAKVAVKPTAATKSAPPAKTTGKEKKED